MAAPAHAGTGTRKRKAATSAASKDKSDADVQVTAGDWATQLGDLPQCSSSCRLRDVARMLLDSGWTAAAVVSAAGEPEGVVTEDDVLKSYFQGAPWDVTVAEWMRGGGGAPLPPADAPADAAADGARSVPADEPVREAVDRLLSPPPAPKRDRSRSGSGFLFVQRSSSGNGGGYLSTLEVTKAMAEPGLHSGIASMLREAAATVADVMEPLEEAPAVAPGVTMQRLLGTLLSSPARAALVSDGGGVRGLATAADAMWAFHEQVARDMDAWDVLSARPKRAGLAGQAISADAPLQEAASAMMAAAAEGEAAARGAPRTLLVVEPGTRNFVGMVSPAHLARKLSEHSLPKPVVEHEAPSPSSKRRRKLSKKRRVMRPHPVTVADIVAQRETATCLSSETLSNAADVLVSSGRSAAVVVNAQGGVRGVLTENDLLAALVDGTPWDCKIDTWLRGGLARLPGFMVTPLTLSPETTLAEAASEMTAQVEEGALGSGFACHHLLVRTGGGVGSEDAAADASRPQVRLLSALDLARGMIDAVAAQAAGAAGGAEGAAVLETSDITVGQAMKDRIGPLASCKLTDPLRKAFEVMFESGQNCAIVVAGAAGGPDEAAGAGAHVEDEEEWQREYGPVHNVHVEDEEEWQREYGRVHGVITASDALRAFSERQRGDRTTVGRWLRGLTPSEHKTVAQRAIRADESLSDAALAMGVTELHHLTVLDEGAEEVVGVLSALDIVCALGACYRYDVASPRGL
uniref:CBS domain-containing protein n=1 Tax=Alexandrium monilatum TaxID=311494 RepID=A0A7S4QJN3_9DINO